MSVNRNLLFSTHLCNNLSYFLQTVLYQKRFLFEFLIIFVIYNKTATEVTV